MSLIPSNFFGGDDFFGPLLRFPLEGSNLPTGTRDLATLRAMPVDVVEQDDKFEVKADIPGVEKNDIKVTVDQGVLRVSVEKSEEKKEDKEEKGRKYHRYERSTTFAGRSLRMPENANLDEIKAQYANGVLTLDVPKKAVGEKTKRIEVA